MSMSAQQAFAGGVAVITGAGSGIGEGLAHTAASIGMRVVLADVAADRIERVAADIRAAGGQVLPVPTDVSDPAALDRLAAITHEHYGDVRLLVNNAGIETLGLSWDIPAAIWEKAIRINVLGVIHGVRAFAPRMLTAGKPACIANVASVGAFGMMPEQSPYMVSKHAVLSFTECLYLEMQLQQKPVQVSVVLPGPVNTRIFADAPTGKDAAAVAKHRATMMGMLQQHGMTGREAADIIMAGLAAGDFWVSTHPEMTAQMAGARAQHLAQRQAPQLTAEARAILGR
jgi:NAD(P)-dependent dehydrogenase (short-subunit alcohol dehydrogenase family)